MVMMNRFHNERGSSVWIGISGGRGSKPIRTIAEITAHIKILPVRPPYLYQKLSQRATQLRLLGMCYEQIAKSLDINRKTATKVCKYEGR